MTDLTNVGAGPDSKTFSLNDLTDWVNQNEAFNGPITQIVANDTETLGVFDMDQDPPVNQVEVRLPPAGGNVVCQGRAWVTGQKTDVIVIRT